MRGYVDTDAQAARYGDTIDGRHVSRATVGGCYSSVCCERSSEFDSHYVRPVFVSARWLDTDYCRTLTDGTDQRDRHGLMRGLTRRHCVYGHQGEWQHHTIESDTTLALSNNKDI